MRQEKKLLYYRKQVDSLRDLVDKLRNENAILRKENQILKNANSSSRESIDLISEEFESIRQEFSINLENLQEARDKYLAATSSVYELKKKYKREMDQFLKGIKKRN